MELTVKELKAEIHGLHDTMTALHEKVMRLQAENKFLSDSVGELRITALKGQEEVKALQTELDILHEVPVAINPNICQRCGQKLMKGMIHECD